MSIKYKASFRFLLIGIIINSTIFPAIGQCDETSVEAGNNAIIISGLGSSPISQAKIFNPNWSVAFECSGNCNPMELIPLPEGTYYVQVRLYNSSWETLCQTANYYTIELDTPCDFIVNEQKQIERAVIREIFQANMDNSLGDDWLEVSNEEACDVCLLQGVTCNEDGYINMLNLMEKNLSFIPASLSNLTFLEVLDLYGNQISIFPTSITNIQSLQKLFISNNQLTSIPESIGELTNLTLLFVFKNQISNIPSSIGLLNNIENFCIYDNPIDCLPAELGTVCGAFVPQGSL